MKQSYTVLGLISALSKTINGSSLGGLPIRFFIFLGLRRVRFFIENSLSELNSTDYECLCFFNDSPLPRFLRS